MTASAAKPAAVPRAVRRAQTAVALVFVAHGLLFASWAAHIPHVKARLGVGDGELGVALLGAPVGSVSAIGLMAVCVPRFGSRRMVTIALVGYCLSGVLVGLAGSVAALFGALFVWGAFQGGLDIAMNTQAISVERAKQRTIMNRMHAYWGVGAFVGAGIGTAAVAAGVGLTAQLLVLGALTLAGALAVCPRLVPDPPHVPDVPEPGVKPARRLSPAMLLLGAIAFASMLCEGASADWSSVYLRDALHTGAGVGGLGYTAFALAMVLVRIFGDRLVERLSARVLLPGLAALATAVFAVALAVGAAPAAVVGFFFLGLGLGTVVPSAFSAAGRLPNVHPGIGVAAVSGLGWAGFVCGPPLIGQLSGALSLPAALVAIPLLTAFVTVATRFARLQPPSDSNGA